MQTQYLDRLLLTPVRRTAILIGHMAADVRVAAALTVPILVLRVVLGVRFEGGLLGALAFILLASLWTWRSPDSDTRLRSRPGSLTR